MALSKQNTFDIRESLMKTCNNEHTKWVGMALLVFWADHVTVHRSISYSPSYAHGIEAVLPLDIAEVTYLLLLLNAPASTEDLIAYHTQQLQKCSEDLLEMSARVLKARKQSAAEFVKRFSTMIRIIISQWLSCPCPKFSYWKGTYCKMKPHSLAPWLLFIRHKEVFTSWLN